MFKKISLAIVLSFLVGCAATSVQPLSQNSFKVATIAESACGARGARNVAFKTAAIEVIRRGGDLFVIEADTTDYDGWSGASQQGMVVRTLEPSSPEAKNALSARTMLGPDWQKIVQGGAPQTCI